MPLRIVFDARRVADFGIGTYIRNLVRSLARIDQENRYILITSAASVPEFAELGDNFEFVVRTGESKTGLAQIGFSLFLRTLKADVFHIPLNAVPLWMPKPYLVTTHDMSTLLFLDQSGYRSNIRRFYLRQGLLRADRVMAVSGATRRDVETVLGIPSARIRVVYNAPDPAFCPPEGWQLPGNGEHCAYTPAMQRVLHRYHIHYPFLLYVGRTNAQKNIPRLVEAFAVLRGELKDCPSYRDIRLIIIGDEISRQPALRQAVIQSRVEAAVRFLGFVPIETLRTFYQLAAAFVFPSLYEGFGLPPLEAMACGTPVVCSNVSSLPEVVGEAAIVVNPENVFDIARGMRDVLLDTGLRRRLLAQGVEQVKKFSWERTAREVHQTYIEIASYKKRPR
ncbi:MAG TPA: glycosyltransferase family 1 protein [Bryobacteraceae bacterium]|nr:glycosyltransferase family 1 protein [Bryobacteraceae bacterium]